MKKKNIILKNPCKENLEKIYFLKDPRMEILEKLFIVESTFEDL